jgi:hypothetical protein
VPAVSITEYLAALPVERRAAMTALRAAINKRLPRGYVEGMLYGGPAWYVPTTRLAETYNGQPLALAVLASRKSHMALYLMGVYGGELAGWFRDAWKQTGKRLDMGKACLRFKSIDDLALDVIGDAIAKLPMDAYVAAYERSRDPKTRGTKPKPAKPAAKKRKK